jgi:hypothetical protein
MDRTADLGYLRIQVAPWMSFLRNGRCLMKGYHVIIISYEKLRWLEGASFRLIGF